jgi:hypothetical protein
VIVATRIPQKNFRDVIMLIRLLLSLEIGIAQ